jgi:hypothetical protein
MEMAMIKGLKAVMIVWGVIHVLLGLVFIFFPVQFAPMMGFGKLDNSSIYMAALCGLTFLSAGVWLIIAARDPLRNIMWVNFAILWASLGVVVQLFLAGTGTISFAQAAYGTIQDFVFAVLFLVFYPYRAARTG